MSFCLRICPRGPLPARSASKARRLPSSTSARSTAVACSSAHRRCRGRQRKKARRGCHREAQGRQSAPAGSRAGGRSAEVADRQPGAAAEPPRARHRVAAPQPDWTQIFGIIGQHFAEAQKAILETQVKTRELDRQIKDLEGKLASLAPAQEERTEVKIFVNAAAPLEADIAIRYQVGAASWVAFYDARLATGTKAQAPKLQLVRRASIQQRSGESWDEVALALSTTRPGAGTAAPELQPVTVDYEPEAPQRPIPPVSSAPRSLTRESGEADRVAAASEDVRRARSGPAPQPVQAEEVRAQVETQAFQAIYAIAGRVTVPPTGEAKRVQIDEAQLDPALTVRDRAQARPEGIPLRQGGDGARHADPAGPSLALPRRHLRRQWPRAPAGAGRGARAGLRYRRCRARAPHHRRGEACRDRPHHVIEDRHAQLSHHRQEPARAVQPRHRPSIRSRCCKMAISRSSCWASRRRPSATSTTSAASSPGK